MFILCKIKKKIPLDLNKKRLDHQTETEGSDCCRLSAQYHTNVLSAIEKWW